MENTTTITWTLTYQHPLNPALNVSWTISSASLGEVLEHADAIQQVIGLSTKPASSHQAPAPAPAPRPAPGPLPAPVATTTNGKPNCPRCGQTAIWREGHRKSDGKAYAFWKCPGCDEILRAA